MGFATAEDGVRIHFEEAGNPSGEAVVLHHGFGQRLEHWGEAGYLERLGERYRLVLMDARGHGSSDKPEHEDAYDYRTRVLDVVAVQRALGLESSHFVGYSMGAMIGMSAAIYAPQRMRSMFLGGASPYGKADLALQGKPFAELWAGLQRIAPEQSAPALEACYAVQMRFGGAVQALRTTRVPFELFAGTLDEGPHRGVTRFASTHGAPHFTLDGRDHMRAFRDADAVAPRVLAFLDGVQGGA
jgi:pimeloyl-ACP methyl ester carboxylesterase